MGFRTVVLSSRAKVEYRLGYMVVRGEEEKQIFLSEINTVIFQSTAISLTAVLLCELVKHRIKVIFCDEKYTPHSELLPYYGSYNNSKKIKIQVNWSEDIKAKVWQQIVMKKIESQSKLLKEEGHIKQYQLLEEYARGILPLDSTNREGHAAKVYFNVLFGDGFCRGNDDLINRSLNYGYAVLLSAVNREIVSAGYLTQLGIFHKNEFNDFNLGCDLMEPFRTIVDKIVLRLENPHEFKLHLSNLLNLNVSIDGVKTTLDIAIKIYTRSVLDSLIQNDLASIKFLDHYEL